MVPHFIGSIVSIFSVMSKNDAILGTFLKKKKNSNFAKLLFLKFITFCHETAPD